MTTHITTHNPVRSDVPDSTPDTTSDPTPGTAPTTGPVEQHPSRSTSRAWAVAGIVAGAAGLGTVATSSMVNAIYDKSLTGDTEAIAAELATQTGAMVAFHTFTMISAVALIVFAAGLQRRLRERFEDGIGASVAFAGLVGTAVVAVLGSGLDTEFIMGLGEDGYVDPANAALYNHWVGTVAWCWALAGLAGLAVFAAFRRGAVPRWLGLVGLVLGGLTVLVGISPLQYLAGMTGPLWLLVTAVGFTVGDRSFRAAQ